MGFLEQIIKKEHKKIIINNAIHEFTNPAIFQFLSTAILTRKYWIPSDLQSQASEGAVSIMVGDHMRILRAVDFCTF